MEDRTLTDRLVLAGKLLGIEIKVNPRTGVRKPDCLPYSSIGLNNDAELGINLTTPGAQEGLDSATSHF